MDFDDWRNPDSFGDVSFPAQMTENPTTWIQEAIRILLAAEDGTLWANSATDEYGQRSQQTEFSQEINTSYRVLNDYAMKGGDLSIVPPSLMQYTTPEHANRIAATGSGKWRHALPILTILAGGLYSVFGAASSTSAATAATSETSAMEIANYTDWVGASDAAAASNAVAQPTFWDRITGIGERALEYGVKQAISKEVFGDNQQPVSTQAIAGASPLANPIPVRGFMDNVPVFQNASMDMKPFLWIGVAFAFLMVFLMAFGRK